MRMNTFLAPALAGLLLTTGAAGAFAADKAEAQALAGSKLSLTQAIEAAEKAGSGKAIDAEFEAKSHATSQYDIKVLGADKLVIYTLDADTGKVVDTSNQPIEKLFTILKPTDVTGAHTTLIQAVGVAEQHLGGKAIDAEVDREGKSVTYDVTVIKSDGTDHTVEVDGTTGKVIK